MRFIGAIISLLLAVTSAVSAQQNQVPDSVFKDEPSAHALYDKMLKTLWNAETFHYESKYTWETQGEELGNATYMYWAKKPNFARLEASDADSSRQGSLILDGESFWVFWPTGLPFIDDTDFTKYSKIQFSSYMQMNAPQGYHSIAHQFNLLGVGVSMPVLNPSLFHKCSLPMDQHLDGVRGLGTERVGEVECELIEVSFMNHQRSKYLWISTVDNLPRKLKEIVRVSYDIIINESWSNITVNGEIEQDKFNWTPPNGWNQYFRPQLDEGLLQTGTEAPDFELAFLDGSQFKLSNHRGKVVWLVFWRVGCPPCRYEFPHLEKLYKQYKDNGFLVVGFNCADNIGHALDFLQEHSITFPNIVDSSSTARDVYFSDYQKLRGRSAVPLNYIIDRDGRIADSWYGFDKDDDRGTRAIDSLMVK